MTRLTKHSKTTGLNAAQLKIEFVNDLEHTHARMYTCTHTYRGDVPLLNEIFFFLTHEASSSNHNTNLISQTGGVDAPTSHPVGEILSGTHRATVRPGPPGGGPVQEPADAFFSRSCSSATRPDYARTMAL